MGSLGSFLIVYVLGGITFLPLVLVLLFLHAILTLPPAPRRNQSAAAVHSLTRPADDEYSLKSGTDQLADHFHRTHASDVAAGYFAVCREYVPGGVNGKPPERTTPAGEVVAAESPSVYQAMYRSLFDRKQAPSIEPTKSNGKSTKRARNVFYIVLRHGHLMLYDDASQVEVRYVISLAHHDVSIYSGGEEHIPEGELWVKRNAICLSRRLDSLGDLGGPTPPFYLFSENLSDKEDFYHAMLHNQSRMWKSADRPPKYQEFDVKDIVTLVQRLHSSEEQLQTRWINAILGRLFLALYRTPEWEEFIRAKITKKISRVNKPTFISRIGLQKIDLGEGAPLITNPRLKDLTVDGNCCVEADMQYTGNFRIEIQATVRIDLGQRFKAREVDIVLAVVLKKLEGHLLVRAKPPPSNRFWMSFETMPRMEMDIQPIVSSKQITYGLILRTIESKIREIVAESIVLPFWDDVPFLDTFGQAFRGGVWQRDIPEPDPRSEIPDESESAVPGTPKSVRGDGGAEMLKTKDEKTMSMPVLPDPNLTKLKSRKGLKSPKSPISERSFHSPSASTTGIDRSDSTSLPRAIRTSQTVSLAADPVVTPDNAKVDPVVSESKGEEKANATSSMIEIRDRSPPASPAQTPGSSPPTTGPMMPEYALHSRESSIPDSIDGLSFVNDNAIERPSPARLESNSFSSLRSSRGSSSTSVASDQSKRRSTIETITRSLTSATSSDDKPKSIGAATAAAKKWGWNVFGKGDQNGQPSEQRHAGTPDQPIGRGHPHPAPGAPLPRPEKYSLKKTQQAPLPKRKPVPPPFLPERPSTAGEKRRPVPPPPLPRRKPAPPSVRTDGGSADELLVVEAPRDSEPSSPALGEWAEDENVRLPEQEEDQEQEQRAVSEISAPVEQTTTDDETAGSVESDPPAPVEKVAVPFAEESDTPAPADLTTTTTTVEEDEDGWEQEAGQEIPSPDSDDQTASSRENNGLGGALPATVHAAPAQSLETEPTSV